MTAVSVRLAGHGLRGAVPVGGGGGGLLDWKISLAGT